MTYVFHEVSKESTLLMMAFDELPKRLRDLVNHLELDEVWKKGTPFTAYEDYALRRYTACNLIRDGVRKKLPRHVIGAQIEAILR